MLRLQQRLEIRSNSNTLPIELSGKVYLFINGKSVNINLVIPDTKNEANEVLYPHDVKSLKFDRTLLRGRVIKLVIRNLIK